MIDFTIPEDILQQRQLFEMVAKQVMRPYSRYYDEHEHEIPWEYVNRMWPVMKMEWARRVMKAEQELAGEKKEKKGPRKKYHFNLQLVFMVEMLSWGDAGIYLCTPVLLWQDSPSTQRALPNRKSAFSSGLRRGIPNGGLWPLPNPARAPMFLRLRPRPSATAMSG